MSLAQVIKTEVHRLGFDLVGITTPDPPTHLSVYEQWVAAGLHGEMGYLATDRARSRRANPREILPDCRSILVLGLRYPTDPSLSNTMGKVHAGKAAGGNAPTGRIAAYASGPDYHDIIPPRLQALTAFLESQTGHPIPHRWYTDTGPLLERDLAQRAGLGWIGKNTCLIAPGLGSFFLLAAILLGVDLEPDPPFIADRCGTCTRCISACPTGCILPERIIDARRCISYLTIELKGAIPQDLRPLLGEWVFGCDICQQVCPWNRFTPQTRSGWKISLEAELTLTPADFNQRFRGTPVTRAKRRGYLRNVVVTLGNAHDNAVIPALVQALLHDPEPLVRGHAAWALGRAATLPAGGSTAQDALQAANLVETDADVRDEIHSAMQNMLTA